MRILLLSFLLFTSPLIQSTFAAPSQSEISRAENQPATKVTTESALPSKKETQTQDSMANLKVTSDEMECTQDQKKCTARGHAKAVKINVPDQQELISEVIIAYFDKDSKTGATKLQRLEASGAPILIHGETVVKSKFMVYDVVTKIAKASGDVQITNKGNQLEGSEGEVNLETGDYKLRREGGQVDALLQTNEKDKKVL